jgi:hypothetical protein
VFVQVLETVTKQEKRNRKDLALCSLISAWPGTPDCPVVHRTVSSAPGWSEVNSPLSGFDSGVRLKIIGLSDGSSAANSSLSGMKKGDVAIIHRTVW